MPAKQSQGFISTVLHLFTVQITLVKFKLARPIDAVVSWPTDLVVTWSIEIITIWPTELKVTLSTELVVTLLKGEHNA